MSPSHPPGETELSNTEGKQHFYWTGYEATRRSDCKILSSFRIIWVNMFPSDLQY